MHLLYPFSEPLPLDRARGLQVISTVAALARAGISIECSYVPVIANHEMVDPFDHYGVIKPAGVTVRPIARNLPWPLSRLHSHRFFVWRWLRQISGKTDAPWVLVRHLKLAAALIKALPLARVIYEAHEVFSDTSSAEKKQKNYLLEQFVYTHSHAVIANSAATAQRLKALYGDCAHCVVIPNGVDRPIALPNKAWANANQHILYAGSFFPWKGVHTLVNAGKFLSGARITLIGGDATRTAELQAIAPTEGAQIVFAGRMSHTNTMQALAGACIAVLPNLDDMDSRFTSPIKLFEYMAAGCAIVASDLPALREILGEDDAVWVPAGDAFALAHGIRTLINDPLRAQQLGERVYARAQAFTWDARAQRIQALLQQR